MNRSAGSGAWALIGILFMLPGCRQKPREALPEQASVPSASAGPNPIAHPTGGPRSCALRLNKQGRDGWSVGVELQNRTDQPIEAHYDHPLTFELEVWAGSKRLGVEIPASDRPVEPRVQTVPPHERVVIPTPVTLRFAPDGRRESDSPFEWVVLGPPTDVWLRAKRVFTDELDLPCELRMHVR